MVQSFTIEAIKERVAGIAKRVERESHIRIVGRATVVMDRASRQKVMTNWRKKEYDYGAPPRQDKGL